MILPVMIGAIVLLFALFVVVLFMIAKRTEDQMLKLEPQPQPDCALGLVTRKAAPPRSSTKSTAEPLTSSRLIASTPSFTPSVSAIVSPVSAASASSNLYVKPAQPPP